MARITVDDQEFTYERQAKTRAQTVFEMVLVVESRSQSRSVRSFEMDVTARGDLTSERIESELEDWSNSHQNFTIQQFLIRERNGCGFGKRVGTVSAEASSEDAASSGRSGSGKAPLYRGGSSSYHQVEFGDVPVERGEEVEFHVAGPSTSVYGTDTGTVTGVKTGTEDYHVLIIETDSGTKRVREDWIVDADDESDESEDGSDDET